MKTNVKYLIGFILVFWSLSMLAQDYTKPNPAITINELQSHLNYLASDDLGGRGIGSAGLDSAIMYVIAQFKGANLKPFLLDSTNNYLQQVEINKAKLTENTTLNFYSKDTASFTFGSEYILAHFGAGNKSLIGEVEYVKTGIFEPEYNYQDYKKEDVKDKWIIINEVIPPNMKDALPEDLYNLYADIRTGITLRAEKAMKNGVIGVLIIPSKQGFALWDIRAKIFNEFYYLDSYKSFHRNAPIPVLFIDSTLLSVINETESISSNVKGKLHFNKGLKTDKISSANILGFVEGTDSNLSNEYIVLGAHVDHIGIKDELICNGADDNASGTSALIEVAEAISVNPFKRSVIFAIFTAEEIGILGSIFMVENMPVPIENIRAMVNLDMIGRLDGQANEIALVSPFLPYEFWKNKINKIQVDTSKIHLDWEYSENFPWKYAGDHYSFHHKKIPTIMLINGFHADYHLSTDDAHIIDFEFLKQNTELTYSIIKMLANE